MTGTEGACGFPPCLIQDLEGTGLLHPRTFPKGAAEVEGLAELPKVEGLAQSTVATRLEGRAWPFGWGENAVWRDLEFNCDFGRGLQRYSFYFR